MLNGSAINAAVLNGNAGGVTCIISADILESDVTGAGYSDFTIALTGDEVDRYVMDLETGDGPVRVPISSWQATLQVDRSNYVQCVIPAVSEWVDVINDATAFTISRCITIGGIELAYVMAIATLELAQFDNGPARRTCTISGYDTGYLAAEDPDPIYDRTLQHIRSVSSGSGIRVRCAIDFLLRPGQRAYADGAEMLVSYINYYVNSQDAYMDVGERA